MTEDAANGLELIDILPNLLEQISFLKPFPEEMNDEEMKLLNKLAMEIKIKDEDEFVVYDFLKANTFTEEMDYKLETDNREYNLALNKKISEFYKKNNLLGIDFVIFKNQFDTIFFLEKRIKYFFNIIDGITKKNVIDEEYEWDLIIDGQNVFDKIRTKYKPEIILSSNKIENMIYGFNDLLIGNDLDKLVDFNELFDKLFYKLDIMQETIEHILNQESLILKIANNSLDKSIRNIIKNSLKKGESVDEISELTNYPEYFIRHQKEILEIEL